MQYEEIVVHLKTKQGYKNLKPLISSLADPKCPLVTQAIQAINQILQSKTTTAELKLYAMRFLKDCLESNNPQFLKLVELQILPILHKMAEDSGNVSSQAQYISDSSEANLSFLKSLFRMVLECIKNRASRDTDNKKNSLRDTDNKRNPFAVSYQKLRNQRVVFPADYEYFKVSEYRKIVSEKGGRSETRAERQGGKEAELNGSLVSNRSKQSSKSNGNSSKITILIRKLKLLPSQNLSEGQIKQSLDLLQKEFDRVMEEYINTTKDFDENYINDSYSKLEEALREVRAKVKEQEGKVRDPEGKIKEQEGKVREQEGQKALPTVNSSTLPRSLLQPKTQKSTSFQKGPNISSEIVVRNGNGEALRNLPEKFEFMKSQSSDSDAEVEENVKTVQHPQPKGFRNNLSTIKEDREVPSTKSGTQARPKDIKSLEPNFLKELSPSKVETTETIARFDLVHQINERIYDRNFHQSPHMTHNTQTRVEQPVQHIHHNKTLSKTFNTPFNLQKTNLEDTKINDRSKGSPQEGLALKSSAPFQTQMVGRITQDYNSFSCAQNLLLQQHHRSSGKLFKLAILNSSLAFYESSLIYIEKELRSSEVKGSHIANLRLLFHTGKVESIQTKFHNARQADIWAKPVSKLYQKQYEQHLAIHLESLPLNLIRASLILDGAMIEYFLPILFISFLKEGDIEPSKFKQILGSEESRVVKSPIFPLNPELVGDPRDFEKYFAGCHYDPPSQSVQMSFLYPEKEVVLLCLVRLHSNQRAQFSCLELSNHQRRYSRELNDNLIFLFTA